MLAVDRHGISEDRVMSNHRLPPPDPLPRQSWPFWVLLFVLGSFAFNLIATSLERNSDVQTVSYSRVLEAVRADEIDQVVLTGNEIVARLSATTAVGRSTGYLKSHAPEMGDPGLIPLLDSRSVEIVNKPLRTVSPWVSLLPWLLILAFYFWVMRRMTGFGGTYGGAMKDFLSGSSAKKSKPEERVMFDDVAGQDSAKNEVAELVEFLRNPEPFQKVGARVPRGVLLMGPPGTGKTLLAKALAGEADVPFFSTSASEFIEVFVGVGASRVRSMFEEARKSAPSIIFIDELDSIGRVRGTGFGGGHDEREQTLNQILAELDGFSGREAVVVLAATNRPDVLDPALLRPGRFDRHVTLSLPDRTARAAILEVHTRNVPVGADVDLDTVAAGTPGFSGADLRNIVNEAAIGAARERKDAIAMKHLDEARDKVLMGTVRTLAIQPEEKHRLAVHEAGHAAVAHFLPNTDPIYKVTIIPRGHALGGTHTLPDKERHTLPEEYLRNQLSVMMGGRAAEQLLIGTVSSGAEDDIKRATGLARSMVAKWGMSDDIGPVDLRQSEEHPFLGREVAQPRHFADRTAAEVDAAVKTMLVAAEAEAHKIIETHRDAIDTLVDRLEIQETLDHGAVVSCLGTPGIDPQSTNVSHLTPRLSS